MADKTIRENFFDAKAIGSLWDVAVSLKRGNPLPIDADSVFESEAKLIEYIGDKVTTVAYPGQVVAVVNTDSTQIFYIDQELNYHPVGAKLDADGKSIKVDNNVLKLVGFDEAADGLLAQVKVDSEGNRTLNWVSIETIAQGDGNTTYTFTGLDKESNVHFEVKASDAEAATKIYLDAYSRKEIDDKFAALVDNDTTYTFENGTEGKFTVTPKDGDAIEIDTGAKSYVEGIIGKASEGETAATGIHKVIEDAAAKAVEDATYDDTAVKEDIQTNADAIADLREDLDAIEIPDVPVTNVSGDGKIIDVTPTDGDYKVSATLSLNYDSTTTKLQLLGINSEVVHEIDAKAFIKDGMLDKVELDTETEEGKAYLVLTWNTDAGKTETSLDVTELIDVYTAGNGIEIENAEINLKLGTGAETAKYLTATEDGLNISGVDKAISDAVAAHNTDKTHLTATEVDSQIDAKLTAADYDKKIADAQEAATKAATDADFITSVNADDNLVVTDKKLHLKDGYQLLADTDKAKLDKLTLDGEDLTISGSVEAGSVTNLDQWISGNRAKVDGLYPAADAEKLEGVEAGAQVNVIEEVQVNGVKVTPDANKAVNIEVPDAVVTSDKENQVTIEEDKTMTVNSLNVNKLVQTAGDTLILYGGSASDLINTNGAE